MRRLALILTATTFGAGLALAEDTTTVIQRDSSPGVSVEHRSTTDSTAVEKRTETTGSVGCTTSTKQKTDAFGDTKTKQKTEC
jgi:hypothetical protein